MNIACVVCCTKIRMNEFAKFETFYYKFLNRIGQIYT